MSEERKEIGKIERIEFGLGGYQDAQIGVSITLSGKGWGVDDFRGAWAIERPDYCKWTEADRIKQLGESVMWLNGILTDAKKSTVSQLKGVPVEATFVGNMLKEWRVLTEVL